MVFLRGRMRVFRLLEFGLSVAGLGGDDSRGYNHSDEGEGDKQIMHGEVLLCESSYELLYNLIIGSIRKTLNPTKTESVI